MTGTEIEGTYENHQYDGTSNKNNWHYVDIVHTGNDTSHYMWSNQAGVSWSLTRIGNTNNFTVGQDCPYSQNYHIAEVQVDDNGSVLFIKGPGGERYDHDTGPNHTSIAGTYENNQYSPSQ